jgi:hypothetical protein
VVTLVWAGHLLREYGASPIGPSDYAWLDDSVPTVAVKAALISVDFSGRSTSYARQRCEQLSTLGKVIRHNFAELKSTGHPKWRKVDLNQEVGIWKRDICSQPTLRSLQTEDDFLRAISDILKGKGQRR